MPLPVVFSLEGLSVRDEEAALFQETTPFGYILFKRNIESPTQLSALTKSLKQITPNAYILIDQEGGRVQRMTAPHWDKYPCMQNCQSEEDVRTVIEKLSNDLTLVGIDTNCAPVLDVLQPDTDQSIGDRAFSDHSEIVAHLGHIACQTFLECDIKPIIKHLPGHGRAVVDSHEILPIVEADIETLRGCDFVPFQSVLKQLYGAELWGMVGHCVYRAIDAELPASLSARVIQEIIRGEIGFDGLLFSDDLSMGALNAYGDLAARTRLCLEAGCDIALYCAGDLGEMKLIADQIA